MFTWSDSRIGRQPQYTNKGKEFFDGSSKELLFYHIG